MDCAGAEVTVEMVANTFQQDWQGMTSFDVFRRKWRDIQKTKRNFLPSADSNRHRQNNNKMLKMNTQGQGTNGEEIQEHKDDRKLPARDTEDSAKVKDGADGDHISWTTLSDETSSEEEQSDDIFATKYSYKNMLPGRSDVVYEDGKGRTEGEDETDAKPNQMDGKDAENENDMTKNKTVTEDSNNDKGKEAVEEMEDETAEEKTDRLTDMDRLSDTDLSDTDLSDTEDGAEGGDGCTEDDEDDEDDDKTGKDVEDAEWKPAPPKRKKNRKGKILTEDISFSQAKTKTKTNATEQGQST